MSLIRRRSGGETSLKRNQLSLHASLDFGGLKLKVETTGLNACSVFEQKEALLLPKPREGEEKDKHKKETR